MREYQSTRTMWNLIFPFLPTLETARCAQKHRIPKHLCTWVGIGAKSIDPYCWASWASAQPFCVLANRPLRRRRRLGVLCTRESSSSLANLLFLSGCWLCRDSRYGSFTLTTTACNVHRARHLYRYAMTCAWVSMPGILFACRDLDLAFEPLLVSH